MRFMLDDLPFFYKNSALFVLVHDILSNSIPLILLKILVQWTDCISWYNPIIYESVELLVFTFSLLDTMIGNPLPIVSPPPV